jgi:hypothetical protein
MRSRFHLFTLFVLCLAGAAPAQYFPRVGREAIHQESLDAQSRLDVLSISLRPGYEDLATLAYLRMGRGARVTSAYVTNGEGGDDDLRGELPMHHAGELREEATKALTKIDGGAFFLNMPDIPAAPGPEAVRLKWRTDTLRARLTRMILEAHPDIILVARDWLAGGSSPLNQVLESELNQVLRHAAAIKSTDPRGLNPWTVSRVLIDRGTNQGLSAPVQQVHPTWKKTYQQIGAEAGTEYRSIAVQRRRWIVEAFGDNAQFAQIQYQLIAPKQIPGLKRIDQGLPAALPSTLTEIGKGIADLTAATLRGQSTVPGVGGKPEKATVRLVGVMQLLDRLLTGIWKLSPEERKIALQWKLSLEDLRATLLGINVRYSFDTNILTERQIAVMGIDTIVGIKPGGTTFLYFPLVDQQGWVVNEQVQKKLDLLYHQPYRILSPGTVAYHLPAGLQGLERNTTATVFLFYIIHQGAKPEENFMYRIAEPIQLTPRFSAEVLTPMVGVVPSERVVIKLTNNSRDGVRDSVFVDDSLATSAKREFRLNTKGGSHVDTLVLTWNRPLEEGTYVLPVKIADRTVSSFAARRFDATMDLSKNIGVITGVEGSPITEVLRRLGAHWTNISSSPPETLDFSAFNVIVIDRRAMTLRGGLDSMKEVFERFVQKGGHLMILAQDAGVWNAHPLVDGLTLKASGSYDETAPVHADSASRLLTTPNGIVKDDWSNWIYQRSYNTVTGSALESAQIPLKSEVDGNPFVAMWKAGAGTITYVDLAVNPQIVNVHPGTYRLLANLLSY